MIQVLATGFGPFPGAPLNPTEALIGRLAAAPPHLGDGVIFRTHVLPTEYGQLAAELDRLGRAINPDLAVHFGLAASAQGFRLERRARNTVSVDRVDAAGLKPPAAQLVPGGGDHLSNLPLDAIETALRRAELPVQHSEDCGDYLCNALFYHSRGGLVETFRPAMSGFIHVPLPGLLLSEDELEVGARLILAEAVMALRHARAMSA